MSPLLKTIMEAQERVDEWPDYMRKFLEECDKFEEYYRKLLEDEGHKE